MYAASFTEHGCGSGGYAYEGVIGYILQAQELGSVPLFRYFNATIQDHFYTSNSAETLSGYVAQGITGQVFTQPLAGTVPLYRFYDGHSNVTDHLYTTNPGETFPLGTYEFEGIPGYVYQGPPLGAVPCVSTGSISKPDANVNFELIDDGFTATSIPLAGRVPGALVNWALDTTYTTSGGVGPFLDKQTTSGVGYDVSVSQTLAGVGGQVTVTAGCETCSGSADPVARRRAVAVFTDIDDAPSRRRLETLANDTDPRVAAAARLSLARHK